MPSTFRIRVRLFFFLLCSFFIVLMIQSFLLNFFDHYDAYLVHKNYKGGVTEIVNHRSIVLAFAIFNSLIAAIILFFRLDSQFIRPLDELVALTERYHDELHMGIYFPNQQRQPFRAVSSVITQMLDRIDADREKLHKKVRELETMNQELIESRKQLVRSEKLATIGQLSAGLAHEIGNPLAIVQGYLDMLKESGLGNEERKQFCEISQSELERVGRLIGELLRFSRSDTVEFQQIFLHDFFTECINLAMMHKSVKQSDLRLDNTSNILFEGNIDMLRQIILNAILNAADAHKKSEVNKIILSGKELQNDKGKKIVEITIEDNGTGVSKDAEEHLFEPFFTTKEAGKGTGLGLFVSQMLVERLGGEIKAGNRCNAPGFFVCIRLPLS